MQMPMALLAGCRMESIICLNLLVAGCSLEIIIAIHPQVAGYRTKVSGSNSLAWQTCHNMSRGGRVMAHRSCPMRMCVR